MALNPCFGFLVIALFSWNFGGATSNTVLGTDKVKFFLYTKPLVASGKAPIQLDVTASDAAFKQSISYFDPTKCTFVFIHGFNGSYDSILPQTVLKAYLANTDCNVILVDYHPISTNYFTLYVAYPDIAYTTKVLCDKLLAAGVINLTFFSIGGHSYGAHITGAIGAFFNGKLLVIVGLDPAGPLFTDAPPNKRLSKDDAVTVIVLHCDDLLGTTQEMGTIDNWLNGGSNQPQCTDKTSVMQNGCSHVQCVYDYALTLYPANNKSFPAAKCTTATAAKEATRSMCTYSGAYLQTTINNTSNPPGNYFVALAGGKTLSNN